MQCEANMDTCAVARVTLTNICGRKKNNPELYKYLTLAHILEPKSFCQNLKEIENQ